MDLTEVTGSLPDLCRRHRVPGAQLVVHQADGTVVAVAGEEAAGTGRPVTEQSRFPLGSLTKPFTATLAMVLVDDGDVDLDEPVSGLLTELRSAPTAKVTLRQLLSHTGGFTANVAEQPPGVTRARWLARDAGRLSAHPSGTAFSYSNSGYLVAACLVERITGLSWTQAMESMLLRPLAGAALPGAALPGAALPGGVPSSGGAVSSGGALSSGGAISPGGAVSPGGAPVPGHVVRPDGSALPIAVQSVPELEEPVAGFAASASTLAAFAAAHLPGAAAGLLAPETAAAMRRDETDGLAAGPFGLADGWGAGWSLYRTDAGPWFGHDGTGDGAWSHLRADPAGGTVVALVANAGTGVRLWEDVVDRLRAAGVPVGNYSLSASSAPARTGRPSAAVGRPPADVAGQYVNGDWSCRVEDRSGDLWLAVGAEQAAPLTCLPGLLFRTADQAATMPYTGRFLRDPASGRIDAVQITGRLARRVGG